MDENPYKAPQENPADFKPTTRPIAKWAWVLLVVLSCLLVILVVLTLQPAIH